MKVDLLKLIHDTIESADARKALAGSERMDIVIRTVLRALGANENDAKMILLAKHWIQREFDQRKAAKQAKAAAEVEANLDLEGAEKPEPEPAAEAEGHIKPEPKAKRHRREG